MNRDVQTRIAYAIETLCNGNKSEFCRRIGRKTSAVKDIIGGKGTAPGFDLLYDILSSDLGISPNWLMLGDGPMLIGNNPESSADSVHKVVLHDIHDNPIVNINYLQDAIKGAIKEAYREIQNEKI